VRLDLSNWSLEELVNARTNGWVGEVSRRTRKRGFTEWSELFSEHFGKVVSISARRRPPEAVEKMPQPRTAADLNDEEDGLLQALRTRAKKAYRARRIPMGPSWRGAPSRQLLAPEAEFYLENWEGLIAGWDPPKNWSLRMVRVVLENWLSPLVEVS
jgi:hypothetical protein